MSVGPVQIILILVVIVLLFGRGKISELMGDVAKGIKSFKKGIAEEPGDETEETAKTINHEEVVDTAKSEKTKAKSEAEG
ncbi:MAG: twin-arginine translocase TatA/TatE family subunit [Hyphomicrobiales bacterium]